jgi:hypothetical protein
VIQSAVEACLSKNFVANSRRWRPFGKLDGRKLRRLVFMNSADIAQREDLDGVFGAAPGPPRAMKYHLTVPAVAITVFAIFVGLYHWARPAYDIALTWYGIQPFQFPFVDTDAITAAIECSRRGIDVYVANPCDALGRPHLYSPLWLAASVLPITRAWTAPVGLAVDLAFILSLAAVPTPRDRLGRWLLLAAALSTMSVYAAERANNDIIMFILIFAAGLTLARKCAARWCGYPLIVLAALLKFYPICALIVSCRERRAAFIVVNFLSLCVLSIFVAVEHYGLARVLANVPYGSYYTDLFGAKNLPYGITRLIYQPSWEPMIAFLPVVLLAALCARALWVAIALSRRRALVVALSELGEQEKVLLIMGAAVVTGCFFAGQSTGYRGIFFILILPGLLALARRTDEDKAGRFARNTAGLILFVMWSEALRHLIFAGGPIAVPGSGWYIIGAAFWIARELVWWRIIAVLGGILTCFVLHSEVWAGRSPH